MTLVKKDELKKSLHRMGVPVYRDDKVHRDDILSLPFQSSGLEVASIEPIKTQKFADYCSHRIHLKIKGGDAEKIDKVFNKNKDVVQKKLSCYCAKQSGGVLGNVEVHLHSRNNENLWLELHFYYNPKAFLADNFEPFCYHLLERS